MSIIQLNDVSKQLGEKKLLQHVTFTFEKGKRYAITGRSGTGKTTLLNAIAGYISCQGQIQVMAENVAYMFQDDLLFSNLTVWENLKLAWIGWDVSCSNGTFEKAFLDKAQDVLELLQIEEFLNTKVGCLSGGERKRVALAKDLTLSPSLFLLDEPVASLDPLSRRLVIKALNTVEKSATIIIVTHEDLKDPTFIRLELKKGTLLYEGE